jgi:7-cyano-7-deazaguanine synthase
VKADNSQGAVILLSGGLDSTVALAMSQELFRIDTALFIDYGQLGAGREQVAASAVASHYQIPLRVIPIPWLGEMSASSLTGAREIPDFPEGAPAEGIEALSRSVWVENRNGIIVNIAAALASVLGCEVVITGFNAEEARTFPDNSLEFVEAVNRSLRISAGTPVRVESPTISMSKKEIVAAGIGLGIPWETIWSCYRPGITMCGRCESCSRLRMAVEGTSAAGRVVFEAR